VRKVKRLNLCANKLAVCRAEASGGGKRRQQRLDGQFTERAMRCFRPAAPRPERRVLREQIASVT
jgi:hypothetical protein